MASSLPLIEKMRACPVDAEVVLARYVPRGSGKPLFYVVPTAGSSVATKLLQNSFRIHSPATGSIIDRMALLAQHLQHATDTNAVSQYPGCVSTRSTFSL